MDLTTAYLGFKLKNPLIASSSPLTLDLDNIRTSRGLRRGGGRAALDLRRTDRS